MQNMNAWLVSGSALWDHVSAILNHALGMQLYLNVFLCSICFQICFYFILNCIVLSFWCLLPSLGSFEWKERFKLILIK